MLSLILQVPRVPKASAHNKRKVNGECYILGILGWQLVSRMGEIRTETIKINNLVQGKQEVVLVFGGIRVRFECCS